MYPKLLGAVQAVDEGSSVQSGGSTAPVSFSRNAPPAPTPKGVTYADVQKELTTWAPMTQYTQPILKTALTDGEAGTPPKAGEEFARYFGPPMVHCVPGWTGPDCRTKIETPTQPSLPPAPPSSDVPDGLPADVEAYSGPMLYQTEAAEGGGVVEVHEGALPPEEGEPGAFDFGKLLPLALIGLSFLRK